MAGPCHEFWLHDCLDRNDRWYWRKASRCRYGSLLVVSICKLISLFPAYHHVYQAGLYYTVGQCYSWLSLSDISPIPHRHYLCLPGYTGRYKDGFQIHCHTVRLSDSSFAHSCCILFYRIIGHRRSLEQTWLALLCHLCWWHRCTCGLAVPHSESGHPRKLLG